MASDDLSDYKVTSEVHVFSETTSSEGPDKIVLSKFQFTLPEQLRPEVSSEEIKKIDDDGDLILKRKESSPDYTLFIKHHVRTCLDLVGLQVWRGALLLADYLLHLASNPTGEKISHNDCIVELGAGTGLTSIVAAMVAGHVTSTDIDFGNILSLIETNCQLNKEHMKGKVTVQELNFYKKFYSDNLQTSLEEANIIIAADVVYHDDLTDAFLKTLKNIMQLGKSKTAYIALEKRFVFTISDFDCVAPCFDYFQENLFRVMSGYEIETIDAKPIPQYFCYEKVKELALFRIKKRR